MKLSDVLTKKQLKDADKYLKMEISELVREKGKLLIYLSEIQQRINRLDSILSDLKKEKDK